MNVSSEYVLQYVVQRLFSALKRAEIKAFKNIIPHRLIKIDFCYLEEKKNHTKNFLTLNFSKKF